jgi:regulator of replication initiation timing
MSTYSKNVLSSSEVDLFTAFVPEEAKDLVKNLFEEMERLRKENTELKEKTADYDGIKGKVDLLLSENMDLRANCGELRAKLEAAEQKVIELNRNLVADAVMSPMAMSLASTLSSTRSSQAALVIGKRSEERTAAAAMAPSALYPVVETHADDASVSELDRANTDLRHAQEVIEAQKRTISSQETTIGLLQQILASATAAAGRAPSANRS